MRRLARDRRGVSALEFAVAVPSLMLILMCFSDVVRVSRGNLRVESTATQVGQIISQCDRVSVGDEAELKKLARGILGSFAESGWAVVVNAVGRDGQDKPFAWKMLDTLPASAAGQSKGSEIPPGLTLKRNQVIFRTEVFAPVKTMLLFRGTQVSATSLHATRAKNVSELTSKAGGGVDCMKEDS